MGKTSRLQDLWTTVLVDHDRSHLSPASSLGAWIGPLRLGCGGSRDEGIRPASHRAAGPSRPNGTVHTSGKRWHYPAPSAGSGRQGPLRVKAGRVLFRPVRPTRDVRHWPVASCGARAPRSQRDPARWRRGGLLRRGRLFPGDVSAAPGRGGSARGPDAGGSRGRRACPRQARSARRSRSPGCHDLCSAFGSARQTAYTFGRVQSPAGFRSGRES